jgi:ribosomal protection tetracycline resistance protein
VFFGSALTGAGVAALTAGIRDFLPATTGDADGPVSGTVFKVERGPAGEKIAYTRMFSGTLRVRDRLRLGRDGERKVTAISVFERGPAAPRASIAAGQIGKLSGLGGIQIGDTLGAPRTAPVRHSFAPPTLETVVVPRHAADKARLHLALVQLAEQDPLINLRRDDIRQETYVSLYGEVQKEVIEATLADDFGIDVTFRETTTICIERLAGTGAAVETLHQPLNPFIAGVGLRIEPAPAGAGVEFRLAIEPGSLPVPFRNAIEDSARATLRQGIHGWEVTDCTVTLTQSGYVPPQGKRGQAFDASISSTAGDFRGLTPLVVMSALQRAGTRVYEPVHRFHLEIPADTLGLVFPALALLHAVPRTPAIQGSVCLLEGDIPAARVHELQQQLPALARGEGVLEWAFDHYRLVRGPVPARARTDHNPLSREEYLLHVVRRVATR